MCYCLEKAAWMVTPAHGSRSVNVGLLLYCVRVDPLRQGWDERDLFYVDMRVSWENIIFVIVRKGQADLISWSNIRKTLSCHLSMRRPIKISRGIMQIPLNYHERISFFMFCKLQDRLTNCSLNCRSFCMSHHRTMMAPAQSSKSVK